ncbi:MAG TPA: MMPL family transporter, partial [Steroidobacteraceae bacterium]|nr:MMPL family transporter [Steroidobacteraceae bacterium]
NGESAGMDRDRAFLFEHRYLLSDSVTPERFTVEGLKGAIQDTVDLLASPAGLLVKELLPHDPTGEMVEIVGQLGGGGAPRTENGVWNSGDGKRALIVAQTRALGSDTDGQQRAVEAIRAAFAVASGSATASSAAAVNAPAAASGQAAANGPAGASAAAAASGPTAASGQAVPTDPHRATLLMSGPGVFAVDSRATIIKEVTRLSILSSAVIVALLLGVYRSATALLLGLVPVASGALAGVAAVALGLGVVHGITLGFGVTLIGEAVDYSIYLFIQRQTLATQTPAREGRPDLGVATGEHSLDRHPGAGWERSVWPTIRLGMLTSVCGFASLLPSGFSGLAQLGLYSIAGLVAAGLVTRFVLPHWLPRNFAIRDVAPIGVAVSRLLQRVRGAPVIAIAVAVLAGIVLYIHRDALWNRELSALSPVSLADQDLDAQLRVDIHAPDVRYLVVVSAPDEQSTLEVAEKVGARLDKLVDADVIGGFDSPAHYLPSQATQRARQASLPAADELRERLQKAVVGMPVRMERLEPFLTDVATARTQPLLTRKDLDNTSMASGFDALMMRARQHQDPHSQHDSPDHPRQIALLPLRASPSNPSYIDDRRVRSAVEAAAPGQATVLDIKGEADALYSTYLSEAVRLSLAGFAAIVILLLIALRSPLRVVRVVIPLALAVLAVAGGFALLGRQLTILHVIGMLLIVAVGSNYALFFDRRATDAHPGSVPLTLASLLIANVATVMSFGILASSSVPVLAALGSTVAPGALLALVFSALLARHLPEPTQAVVG